MNKSLMSRGMWNSLILSLFFLGIVITDFRQHNYIGMSLGLFVLIITIIDTIRFYEATR